jgi:hypothetical protein
MSRAAYSSRGARYQIEIHEEHAVIVRRIFALAQDGLNPSQIATALEQELIGIRRNTPRPHPAGAEEREQRSAWLNFPRSGAIQAILAHEELYRTGRRVWNGVTARVQWPILLADPATAEPPDESPKDRD